MNFICTPVATDDIFVIACHCTRHRQVFCMTGKRLYVRNFGLPSCNNSFQEPFISNCITLYIDVKTCQNNVMASF